MATPVLYSLDWTHYLGIADGNFGGKLNPAVGDSRHKSDMDIHSS